MSGVFVDDRSDPLPDRNFGGENDIKYARRSGRDPVLAIFAPDSRALFEGVKGPWI